MGVRLNVAALLSSFALFACGAGASHGEVKGPESDPWAGYKGTYATDGASGSPAARLKAAKNEPAKVDPSPAAVEATDATTSAASSPPIATPAPSKKAKSAGKSSGKATAVKKKQPSHDGRPAL